jgi:uncharacterized protein YndB with AHSA1/START domain
METVTSSGKATVTLPDDTQIRIEREFDAPARLLWRAMVEPELIKRWWSGKRGEVTEVEVDLRVGGSWRQVMVTTDGFEVAFHGTYREIAPYERLVTTEMFEGAPGATEEDATLNTVTLVERDGVTTLTTLVECRNSMIRDAIIESGMEGGMQEAFDALEDVARSLA